MRFVAPITITFGRRVEAVHLGQDLVQRLLALVAAAEAAAGAAARAADRVELVDEDDRRRLLLRLPEQVAHARGADADDRLDELRRRHREERRAGLAGDRPREQRLAGARRPAQQHAARDPAAEPAVLVRVAQEVDDLGQLLLRLVDARDVGEGDRLAPRLVAARRGAARTRRPSASRSSAGRTRTGGARGGSSGRSRAAGSPHRARRCRAAAR